MDLGKIILGAAIILGVRGLLEKQIFKSEKDKKTLVGVSIMIPGFLVMAFLVNEIPTTEIAKLIIICTLTFLAVLSTNWIK